MDNFEQVVQSSEIVAQNNDVKMQNKINVTEILPKLALKVGQCLYESQIISRVETKKFDKEAADVLFSLLPGIYYANDGYYIFVKETKNTEQHIRRLTNWTGVLQRLIVSKNFNHPETHEHKYGVKFNVNLQKIEVTLAYDVLMSIRKFETKMSEYAHIISVMDEKQHKNVIAKILSSQTNEFQTTEYDTAGLNYIDGEPMFITADRYYKYGKQDKNISKIYRLSKNAILQPKFVKYYDICKDNELKNKVYEAFYYCPNLIVSRIVLLLINMLEKAYNGRLEPFIVIGMCFMTLFLKQISNDFEGTPIVALYGEPASGKSNLLRLCASAFGLDKSVLHGGMDTMAGIINDLENYVNIPLLIDEVELNGIDEIKRLIKAVYGQTGRKKYSGKNNINTTLFYNTNNEFLYDLEYKNRCIELNFIQADFNAYEAEKFNPFQKYLSYVSQYIIEHVKYEEIKEMVINAEKLELLSKVPDKRIKRNMAIAISGLNLLVRLVYNSSLIGKDYFTERLKKFIDNTSLTFEDDIEKFITVFKELIRTKCIEEYVDYKIGENYIHIAAGKYARTFEMHFKSVYTKFYKGAKPLKFKEYQKKILACKKSDSNNVLIKPELKSVYYSPQQKQKHGIILPFAIFDGLGYLADKKDLTKLQSNIYNKDVGLDELETYKIKEVNKNFELTF